MKKFRLYLEQAVKSLAAKKYNPARYWKNRHKQYGFDIRGVGNCTLSKEENERIYKEAGNLFLTLCQREGIVIKRARTLDIGCGTGFYANILHLQGTKNYVGIDITDQLFPDLQERFPDFSFLQADITRTALNKQFDLIIMIDVTQHIVDDQAFFSAMANVKSCLAPNGVFIVTSWLSKERKPRTFYEVERPKTYYEKAFHGYSFSEIIPFRDKFIFTIQKKKAFL